MKILNIIQNIYKALLIFYIIIIIMLNDIIKRFPLFKLSYDKIINKKVYANIYQAIPYGKKYYVWFTYYKTENICLLLEIDKTRINILNWKSVSACYSEELCYNTILYGTYVKNKIFVIEDIYYYKNKCLNDMTYYNKFNLLEFMLTNELSNANYTSKSMIWTIPLSCRSYNELIKEIDKLNYSIYNIAFINNNKYNYRYILKYKNLECNAKVFKIKADLQNDIYNLYCLTTNKFYDVAYIPTYKLSMYMNSLFRNIKENNDLDLLEESDDEETFENISPDKYVDLHKEIKFSCIYNKQFNKWVPNKMVST